METKQITLRSQTTQCPHCGEYYSVTYKYCPFCDVGRKEEERRQAEKKKNRQAKLGGLFGGAPEKKKKPRPEGASPKQEHPRRETPAERPAREYPERDHRARPHVEAAPEVRTHPPKEPAKKPAKKKESLFFQKETRKKTSELTEEEKKARLAEREARAAERKRLRDQAAREAAMAAMAEPAAPILEADDLSAPPISVEPAPQEAQPAAAEVPAAVTGEPTPVQEAPAQTTPEPEPVIQDAGTGQWEILRELESVPNAPVVEVADATPEVTEPAPQAPVQAQPAQPREETPSAEAEEDLDALLSEIRDMLADSPVPQLNPEELKKPAPPVAQTEISPTVLVEGGAHLAAEEPAPGAEEPAPVVEEPVPGAVEPAPVVEEPVPGAVEPAPIVEEPAPTAEEPTPVAEEPTIVLPHLEDLSAGTAPAVDVAVDDQPTQILPTIQEIPAPAPAPAPEHKPSHKAAEKKPKKKTRSHLLPIILSLILVAAAAVIVVKQVLPAFQDGLFSGQGKTVAAESLTLDQTDVSLSEPGQTVTLTAALAPEGAAGAVTWASSDEAVATVDQNGLVTAVAPGEVTVTAAIEGGASAQCVIHCAWTAEESQPPAGPALSAGSITLAAEGETKQLQVTGAAGAVKWTSSKPEVAAVADDGTVTAVTKGGATITAEVDGEKFECDVKCIW